MNDRPSTYQIAIVGGGAVGLFLGICLQTIGISCVILEKRPHPREGSRSLGIHPVSLELFEQLGIVAPFIEQGIHIRRGHAFSNNHSLGTLSFENCPQPFNYILALPQYQTETILEQRLNKLNPDTLIREAEVLSITQNERKVTVRYLKDGHKQKCKADFIVGCDGKHSLVRKQADIPFKGKAYPDTYIMGDFDDNTNFGSDAAIFLCKEGLIESFPLPDNKRRWVVKTSDYLPDVGRQDIEQRVSQRIGYNLNPTGHSMLSSFGVQKLVAKPMVRHRVILAGDAAHVVSPIGGQGMNLGWLGAWKLAQAFNQIYNYGKAHHFILKDFEQQQRIAVNNAIHRAELNMRLGRAVRFPTLRDAIVSLMLKKPIAQFMARIFTMRGLGHWII